MIDLDVPRERVRIFQMVGSCVLQQLKTNWLDDKKSERTLALIMFKRTDIEKYLVVEKTDTAAYNSATGAGGRNNKAQTRRQIVVLSDTVTVIPQYQVQDQVGVHD